MSEPNSFQTKIAVSKAFSSKKLPMNRLHQLYKDIYNTKSKIKSGGLVQEEEKSSFFHHEEDAIMDDTRMERLVNKYIKSENVDFFQENEMLLRKKSSSTLNPLLKRLQTEELSSPVNKNSQSSTFDLDAKDKSLNKKSQSTFLKRIRGQLLSRMMPSKGLKLSQSSG